MVARKAMYLFWVNDKKKLNEKTHVMISAFFRGLVGMAIRPWIINKKISNILCRKLVFTSVKMYNSDCISN